jgi:transposase
MADHFWLSDAQWAVIEPHIPKVYKGKRRVDDRRVISGIVHRLREGCRWRALPDVYGPYTTVFNRYNRWSKRGLWQRILASLSEAADPPVTAMIDSTSVKAHRSAAGAKGGASAHAIGQSRGGRTTKVHMLVDEAGRLRVVQLSPGQASDIVAAHDLIVASRPSLHLLADRACDGNALRRMLIERGTTPVIPNKINRVNRHPFDAAAYRLRNAVERAFCRLKDFRAVATRYDKTARNYLAGLCTVAAITLWAK